MDITEKDSDCSTLLSGEDEHDIGENDGLLKSHSYKALARPHRLCLIHIVVLYVCNVISLVVIAVLWSSPSGRGHDPTLGVYSPANEAVEYVEAKHFRAALFNLTEYMGYPTADGRTDQLWSDLYNFGISKITKEQATKLHSPTLAIPGTEDYLVELDVWHELHCLNDLRKILYPEVYGGLSEVTWPNGTINRDTDAFRHWDHCIDSLRQTLMCHADVAPIPFHVNIPAKKGIFPRLATTHTCRNFERIQQWSRDNWAGDWDFNLNPEKADEIIAASGFDNDPEEDIEFLWRLFPGDPFFKHWREHQSE
ncbi:hypothetical protein BKA67DRAFT_659676 [Truncatella angustata]|uniref:Uncharacterized protein n=1 Tax=Truncatella angustata TaxID=152316 RepID=A0A9P8ZXI7_9PEZI|nr:uncharacterized protein BKA67DRAFT_659676 [Truncatella angustata]KAH6653029.1 hypothetical protein BKA67DRAFT_659676 [Truncatella angustata]